MLLMANLHLTKNSAHYACSISRAPALHMSLTMRACDWHCKLEIRVKTKPALKELNMKKQLVNRNIESIVKHFALDFSALRTDLR